MDILEYIKKMQEMYGDDVITTADKINRPDPKPIVKEIEAINEFVRRNPRADGGRIGFSEKPGAVTANVIRQKKAIKNLNDKWTDIKVKKTAEILYPNQDINEILNNAQKRRKINKHLTNYGEGLPEEKARKKGRQPRILKEQGIQIKLLEATNKKGKFNAVKFAKDNKISMKELKYQAKLLRNNIYDKRMLVSGKDMGRATLEWIPNDLKAADNALDKMWKSELIVNDRGKIENLFYDAFGKPDSPTYNAKKYLAIRNNLTEYYQLRDAINLKYPNINFQLDHPLSKSTLNKIFNASADKLTRVNILDAELNNNFKKSLSSKYENAISSKNLKAKKTIDKIAKDLNLNIGKVTQNLTGYDYGVKEFQKLNIKDEIIKSVKNQKDLSLNFKNYIKKNPELLKIAGYTTKDIEKLPFTKITKITDTQISGIVKMLNKSGFRCGAQQGLTCKDPRAYTKSIMENMELAKQGDNAAVAKINKMGKLMKGFKGAAKWTGWGLLAEVGFAAPLAAVDYAKGANKDEIISNITYGLAGKSMKEQLKEIDPRYGQAQRLFDLYDKAQKAEELTREQGGYRSLYTNLQREEDAYKAAEKAMDPFMMPTPHLEEGRYFDENKVFTDLARDEKAELDFLTKKKRKRSRENGRNGTITILHRS